MQEYAQLNWKVLDPTLGSGSSRIAAYNLGLDFVGLEKDVEHFRDQEERWSREVLGRTMSLFEYVYLNGQLQGSDQKESAPLLPADYGKNMKRLAEGLIVLAGERVGESA